MFNRLRLFNRPKPPAWELRQTAGREPVLLLGGRPVPNLRMLKILHVAPHELRVWMHVEPPSAKEVSTP